MPAQRADSVHGAPRSGWHVLISALFGARAQSRTCQGMESIPSSAWPRSPGAAHRQGRAGVKACTARTACGALGS